MSQGQFAPPKKSSPCCIGCIVLIVIAIIIASIGGVYMWRFAKDNFSLVKVTTISDPAQNTPPEVLLPEQVGDFHRETISDNLNAIPEMASMQTSGVVYAKYKDSLAHEMDVIAVPTQMAREQRKEGGDPSIFGRGKINSSDTGISIRDPYTRGGRTIVTWSKPNWTFTVQTTTTLAQDFINKFSPGSTDQPTTDTAASDASTTAAP